jgi:hypothetical protein
MSMLDAALKTVAVFSQRIIADCCDRCYSLPAPPLPSMKKIERPRIRC